MNSMFWSMMSMAMTMSAMVSRRWRWWSLICNDRALMGIGCWCAWTHYAWRSYLATTLNFQSSHICFLCFDNQFLTHPPQWWKVIKMTKHLNGKEILLEKIDRNKRHVYVACECGVAYSQKCYQCNVYQISPKWQIEENNSILFTHYQWVCLSFFPPL